MNQAQRSVLIAGLVVVIALGLAPPWKEHVSEESGTTPATGGLFGGGPSSYSYPSHEESLGYALLFMPPSARNRYGTVAIDFERLVVSWVIVGAASAVAALAIGRNRAGAHEVAPQNGPR